MQGAGIKVNFKPSVKQYKAWEYLMDKDTLFIGYGGAAFSGKSYLLCYWLTSMCIAYPDTAWGLGRKALTTLKKTTLLTLFKVFDECGIKKDEHYNYNQQDNTIKFYNNSIIFLIDTAYQPSDPLYTRFGGLELTGAAVDESAETSYEAIKILFTRLGRRNNGKYNLKKKLLETFNPAKNHVYTRYYKPHQSGEELENHVFIPALPKDNPAPEVEDYIKDIIATSDKVTIERLINGNFEYDDDPSALMSFDAISAIFSNNVEAKGEKYITADIARFGADSTIVVVWHGLVAMKIFRYQKLDTTQVAAKIKEIRVRYGVPIGNVIADEDGVGGGVVDQLKCKGFLNGSRALKEENFRNLKSQCYFKLSEIVNKGDILIKDITHDDKTMLIEELEQVKQHQMDKDGKKSVTPKEEVKKVLGRSPDLSDAIMMRAYFEYFPVHKTNSKLFSSFG